MFCSSTLRNQSFKYLCWEITAGLKKHKKEQGSAFCKQFFVLVVALFQLGFLSACFDCLNITFLTQLQGNGLEEGADLCVFYTHLTKLLNLIALRGIILFCGNLTLFFDLCGVFILIKCCEIEFFCGTCG